MDLNTLPISRFASPFNHYIFEILKFMYFAFSVAGNLIPPRGCMFQNWLNQNPGKGDSFWGTMTPAKKDSLSLWTIVLSAAVLLFSYVESKAYKY